MSEVDQVDEASQGSQDTAEIAAAEEAIGDNPFFAEHDAQDQADSLEQEGIVDEDHPDGDGLEAEAAADPQGGDDNELAGEDDATVSMEDATVEELLEAEKAAAAAGEYAQAQDLRTARIEKEKSAPPPASQTAPKGDVSGDGKSALSENERTVMKDLGGWTDEDIDTLEKANPAFAKLTAKKLADGYNNLSLQYVQVARNGTPNVAPSQPQPQQNAATTQQTATLESLYKDLDKFSEIAGNDMVERFIKPLKNEVLDPLRDVVQFVNEQRDEATRREVNAAVTKVAKGGYEKHYGEDASALTDAQREARQQLAQVADMIHSGAKLQKVNMSFGEAIRRAHLILTADKQQAQARTALVKQVKTRSSQITSRPTQRVNRLAPRGEAAAAKVVENFWESRD